MRLAAGVALLVSLAPVSRAEIALLRNGMTLKLESHRIEGESVFLLLEGGGEVGTHASEVEGFLPDEIVEEVQQAIVEQQAAGLPTDLGELVAVVAKRHGLDPVLVWAVVSVESAFQPRAVSPKGAQGLMQLMPATARELGVADSLDPAQNLDGGTRHLRALLEQYKGDLKLALAAYNAGAGAVRRHGGVPPYRETRDYVDKVLRRYQAASQP